MEGYYPEPRTMLHVLSAQAFSKKDPDANLHWWDWDAYDGVVPTCTTYPSVSN